MQSTPTPGIGPPATTRQTLFQAIRDTAVRQRTAIEHDDLGTFQTLLAQREALVAETAKVSEGERAAAADVLKDIVALDEENQRLLSARIEEAQRELGAVRGGRRALSAYTTLAPHETSVVDRRG